MIFDLLKFISGVLIILGVVYWWITKGPPPRGKGRWRDVL